MLSTLRSLLASIPLTVLLVACTTPNAGHQPPPREDLAAGSRYTPRLPAGLDNLAAVQQDIRQIVESPRNPGIKILDRKGLNDPSQKDSLEALVKGHNGSYSFWYGVGGLVYMTFSSLSAFDDRIEVNPGIAFHYADLVDAPIYVEKAPITPRVGHHIVGQTTSGIIRPYMIEFPGRMAFYFEHLADAKRFADDLFYIQQDLTREREARVAAFEARVAEYRRTGVKPAITEEQRKYIVQANALNQRKDYAGAVELYLKAVAVDPIAYPAAYFNLALLSAQQERYKTAIGYMQQYLLLEPEAPDARSAQDKIYEWELLAGQSQ
jgi:tetratricopeptide (TPR) repeat protein